MIVVAGEALIDLVADGDGALRAHCGGGPFNTARALARLGQPVAFLGAISEDPFGVRLRGALEDDGVDLGCAVATRRPTTLALAQTDASGTAVYRFYIEGTSAPALTAARALAVLPARLDALCVGSFGLVLEPLADAVAGVLAAEATAAALVMLDPNVRPSLIGERDRHCSRLEHALARSDVLKASVEDLAWLHPGERPAAAARALLRHGPSVALVTCGADGALAVWPDGERTIAAPAVEVVDTIGAGDAFSAAFLAFWRHRGLPRERLGDLDAVAEAARFACRVAAATCERAGAQAPALAL